MSDEQISTSVAGNEGAQESPKNSGVAEVRFAASGWGTELFGAEPPSPAAAAAAADADDAYGTGPAARLRRFRERRRRFDYIPGQRALNIIQAAIEQNPHLSTSAVIDHLVLAGAEHYRQCESPDIAKSVAVQPQNAGGE